MALNIIFLCLCCIATNSKSAIGSEYFASPFTTTSQLVSSPSAWLSGFSTSVMYHPLFFFSSGQAHMLVTDSKHIVWHHAVSASPLDLLLQDWQKLRWLLSALSKLWWASKYFNQGVLISSVLIQLVNAVIWVQRRFIFPHVLYNGSMLNDCNVSGFSNDYVTSVWDCSKCWISICCWISITFLLLNQQYGILFCLFPDISTDAGGVCF